MKIKYSRFADFLEFFKKTGKILVIGIYFFALFFISFALNFENFAIFSKKEIAYAATEFVSKVKESCSGESAPCYTSLSDWEVAYGGINFGTCALGDLVCADKIAVAKIEGNWTKPDTSAMSINGWTTDSVRYIKIYTAPDARHKGYLKSNGVYSGYVLKNSSGSSIRSYEEYVKIDGLLIENSSTGAYDSGFRLSVNNDKSENVISNTIIKRSLGGSSTGGAISKDYYFGRYKIINSIAQVDSAVAYAIKGAGASNYSEIYNTVVYGSGTKTGISNALAKNTITANFTSGFSGSSGDFNCATDSTAPGVNSLSSKTLSQISFDSVSPENENFHLNSNSVCADKGTNLSSIFNNDIDYETRTASLWDIGADEISGSIIPPPVDTDAPLLSSGSPSGILPVGTISTTLSVSTNENAVCKYSNIPNLTYSQMVNLFSATGGTSHSKTITGYIDGNSYNYYVRCVDGAGNANLFDFVISFSVDKEIGVSDTLAPSIPSNLTAGALSSSEININWSASTDNVGVAGYKVYRNNIEIGTTKALSFLDSGLTAATTYSYTLSAYDAAGNNSIKSSSVSASTKSVEIIPIDKGGVYYMSITGSDLNSGSESFPFKTFKHAFTKMKSGETLIVKDGAYDQRLGEWKWLNSVKVPTSIPPSGTPEKYTTVRGQNVRAIVNSIKMVGASYVRIEGFKSLGKIDTDNSNHIIYKKIAAKGGISTTLSSYITKEDVWSWEDNRYTIHNFKSDHITDNRVIARLDDLGAPALLPVGAISHYLTDNSVIANALLFDVSGTFSQPYDLVYSSNPNIGNNQLWGIIGFNAGTQLGGLYPADGGGGNNYEINNSVIWGTSKRCIRFNALAPLRVKNNTCGENGEESVVSKSAPVEVQNNIFYKNGGGISSGITSCDNNLFYLSGSVPVSCKNSSTENPQIKWLPRSPVAGKGANVLKKYNVSEVSGALKVTETTQNLWPWPYEDLIKADMCEGTTKGWCGTNKTLTQYIWEYLGNPIPPEIYGGGGGGGAQDIEAPTVPKNLIAEAVSDTQINLSWSSSSDNIGVTGYKIFRNGAQIASVNALSYSDTGLSSATIYSYAISAYDAAGNNSLNSVSVSAKTKDSIIVPPLLTECADALILCVDDTIGVNQEYSTIQAAANVAKPGSTVVVYEGNYTGFEISVSGISSSPIIFKALGNVVINKSGATGDGVRIQNASYVKIEGFKIENTLQRCIAARGATSDNPMRGIVIQNNICNNAGWEGFYLSQTAGAMFLNNTISGSGLLRIERNHGIYLANAGSDNSVISGNTISGSKGTGSEGIHINGDLSVGGDGLIKNVIIENNFINNNAANGISLDGVQDLLIQNNVIYKNGRHALRAYKGDGAFGPKNLKAVNNTFIAGSSGWAIKISEDLGGHTIFNNILLSQGSGSISLNSSSFVSNKNILSNKFSLNNELSTLDLISWQKSGYDLNSFISVESELFTNSLNSDYSLKDASKAINAGVNSINLISAPNTDIKGILRPQGIGFDVGAYEKQIINTISVVSKDSVPPSKVLNLSALSKTEFSILLSWTASGDDGNAGTASLYDIRYSLSPITEENFGAATKVENVSAPKPVGLAESILVTALREGTKYYFALKSIDEVGNISILSNIAEAVTRTFQNNTDIVPPGKILNLSAKNITSNSAGLSFTAPGDDRQSGAAVSYDIRYSNSLITETSWNSAVKVPVSLVPKPGIAGTVENFVVPNLNSNSLYYFAVKSLDEVPNTSALSNIASFRTLTLPALALKDINPPLKINDLFVKNITENKAALSWTSPKDNEDIKASVYDIRFSGAVIDEGNFESASKIAGAPIPSAPGSLEEFNVFDLTPDTLYYFAVRSLDKSFNKSLISNVVSFKTLPKTSGNIIAAKQGDNIIQSKITPPVGGGGGGGFSLVTPPPRDTTPPPSVSNFTAVGDYKKITLSWVNPLNSDFAKVIILRKEDSFSNSIKDGRIIYEGSGNRFIDSILLVNKKYFYSIFAHDTSMNYSKPAFASASAQSEKTEITVPIGFFKRNLYLGLRGEDVKKLQQILNSDSDTRISETGQNSPGKETGYFDRATKRALMKFQEKYKNDILTPSGLVSPTGYFGPATIKKIYELYGEKSQAVNFIKPTKIGRGFFKRNLFLGMIGEDVRKLQEILNFEKDTQVENSGTGSPGNESNYFGIKTKNAVARFQEKFKDEILSPAGLFKATGYFGRLTIKKIEEIYGV